MKKLLKASLLSLLPIMCLLAFVACKAPTGPVNYNVSGAANDIPTITSVVGERTFEGSSVTRAMQKPKREICPLPACTAALLTLQRMWKPIVKCWWTRTASHSSLPLILAAVPF